MEMEQLYGSVGVKCPIRSVIRDEETGSEDVLQEGVEVTPSRETVIWSEHTRNFLKKAFKEAVEEATNLVQSKLLETDFISWLAACKDILSGGFSNGPMYHLSKVVDTHGIRPSFNGTSIKYSQPDTMFRGFKARVNKKYWDNAAKSNGIERAQIAFWGDLNTNNIYIKSDKASLKKDMYIESLNGTFVTIEPMNEDEMEKSYLQNETMSSNLSDAVYKGVVKNQPILLQALKDSGKVKYYDDIEVPEDFGKTFDESEIASEELRLTPAQKRKLEEKIVVQFLAPRSSISWGTNSKAFIWKQQDTKVEDILNDQATCVYGFNADEEQLHFTAMILSARFRDKWDNIRSRYNDKNNKRFYNDDIKLIKINKGNEKHFKGRDACWHVNDFFQKTTSIDE